MGEVTILNILKTFKTKHPVILVFLILFLILVTGILAVVINPDVRLEAKKTVVYFMHSASGAYLKTQKGLPILSYHGVVPVHSWGIKEYFVSAENFEKQVRYLKENGYTSLTFNDIGNFKSYEKPVIITFDDGYESVYKYAYPILKKYNMRATLFMVSDFVGQKYFLNVAQLNKLSDVFDIQSHTKTHPELSKTTAEAVNLEMSQSKIELSNLLEKPITVVSYPYSKVDTKVIIQTSKYYNYGILNWGGKYYGFEGQYRVPRIPIHWDDTLDIFIAKIS